MGRRDLLIAGGTFAGLALFAPRARAAPDADLWERWLPYDAANPARIEHGEWDAFVQRHRVMGVDGVARIAYRAVTFGERDRLQRYIESLSAVPIRQYRREAQLPYWLNLYNALVIRLVLDFYPVESIEDIDISPGFFASGPWEYPIVEIEDATLTLDDIEHRILRPIWRDPLIHYGLNCGAIGCPNLPSTAFTAENVALLLVEGAALYVNDPRGARIDGEGDFVVSEIYDWYEDDFGDGEEGVLAHLGQYAGEHLRAMLLGRDGIDDYQYDWSLNDAVI
jgi:hypothetical protein